MTDDEPGSGAADALVAVVAGELGSHAGELSAQLRERLSAEIPGLAGDAPLQDLLMASIESNLEAFVRIIRYGLPLPSGASPPAAAGYARRLAQRGTDPSALLRSYRLGQEGALLWSLDRIAELASDGDVALLAGRRVVQLSFQYVDAVSTQVLSEYESERVRWLANSNSVRSAVLGDLLDGHVADVDAAEAALDYRLRQHHVGVVLWIDHEGSPDDLRALEQLLIRLARACGARGPALFVPQDRSSGWGWLPFGRHPHRHVEVAADLRDQLAEIDARAALGGSAVGVEGFRSTHLEARRAQELTMISRSSGGDPPRVTSYGDPDVRAATLMMRDLETTRRLVAESLGGLATDDEASERLRLTVRTFLAHGGSYAESAEALTLHKNTVRYRLERAVEARGRSLDEDRLDLELALIACAWLGSSVL